MISLLCVRILSKKGHRSCVHAVLITLWRESWSLSCIVTLFHCQVRINRKNILMRCMIHKKGTWVFKKCIDEIWVTWYIIFLIALLAVSGVKICIICTHLRLRPLTVECKSTTKSECFLQVFSLKFISTFFYC